MSTAGAAIDTGRMKTVKQWLCKKLVVVESPIGFERDKLLINTPVFTTCRSYVNSHIN